MEARLVDFASSFGSDGQCLSLHSLYLVDPAQALASIGSEREFGLLDDGARVDLGMFMSLENLMRNEDGLLRSCKHLSLGSGQSSSSEQLNAVLALAQRYVEMTGCQQRPQWEQLQSVVLDQRQERQRGLREVLEGRIKTLGPLILMPRQEGPVSVRIDLQQALRPYLEDKQTSDAVLAAFLRRVEATQAVTSPAQSSRKRKAAG